MSSSAAEAAEDDEGWNMAVATTFPKAYAHITKAAGVCGGKACIDDTVHAALADYYDHHEEIEAELADEEDMQQLIERSRAEYLKGRTAQ